MTRQLALLLLLPACADVTAPPVLEPPAVPAPVLRFVGICDRPAVWWVMRDTQAGHDVDIWFMTATDSVDIPPIGALTLVTWYELDGIGQVMQSAQAGTDSLGAARVAATCLPPG
jgi:hypothetical protein